MIREQMQPDRLIDPLVYKLYGQTVRLISSLLKNGLTRKIIFLASFFIGTTGQFVILRPNESGERIPMTMADINPEKGTITIIGPVPMMKQVSDITRLKEIQSLECLNKQIVK